MLQDYLAQLLPFLGGGRGMMGASPSLGPQMQLPPLGAPVQPTIGQPAYGTITPGLPDQGQPGGNMQPNINPMAARGADQPLDPGTTGGNVQPNGGPNPAPGADQANNPTYYKQRGFGSASPIPNIPYMPPAGFAAWPRFPQFKGFA